MSSGGAAAAIPIMYTSVKPMEDLTRNKDVQYDEGNIIKRVWEHSFENIYNEGLDKVLNSDWSEKVTNRVTEHKELMSYVN